MSWQIAAIALGVILGLAGIALVGLAWWWGRAFRGWDWNTW